MPIFFFILTQSHFNISIRFSDKICRKNYRFHSISMRYKWSFFQNTLSYLVCGLSLYYFHPVDMNVSYGFCMQYAYYMEWDHTCCVILVVVQLQSYFGTVIRSTVQSSYSSSIRTKKVNFKIEWPKGKFIFFAFCLGKFVSFEYFRKKWVFCRL